MPEPLTIAGTAIAGTRLGVSLYKEIKKVCKWLTGNLDSVGKFSLAGEFSPDDLIAKYHKFYIDNTQNQQALSEALARLSILGQKAKWFSFRRKTKSQPIVEKLLFKGMPKIGKTRAVYEKVIKRFPDFLVFLPSPVELGKVRTSELKPMPSKRGLILFLDDIDQFVVSQDIDLRYLISCLQNAGPRLLVVATLRTGVEMTKKVMTERHGRDLLQDFQEINFRGISNDEARQLAQSIGKAQYEFDGESPGSVILGLGEMRQRLEGLGINERAVCRTLKLLYFALKPVAEKGCIRAVSDKVFQTRFSQMDSITWDGLIRRLRENDLIRDLGQSVTAPHSDYHRYVYDTDYVPPSEDLYSLKDVFAEKGDVPALTNLGNSLILLLGMREEAVSCYDSAIEIQPKYAIAWYNRGVSLTALGRHEEAIKSYDRAIEIEPRFAILWVNRGYSLSEVRRHEEAIKSYDRAIEIEPKFASVWYNKGLSLCRLGRHKEAIESYDKAIEIEPKETEAWVNKSASLAGLDKYEDAIESYDRAIEIEPKETEAWVNRGTCLVVLGRHKEAIESFEKALQINPLSFLAWHNKGICLRKMGKVKKAEECRKMAEGIEEKLKEIINEGKP